MTDSMDLDMTEVFALAADLGRVDKVLVDIRVIMQKALADLRNKLRAEASGVRHAPGLPAAITFETKMAANGIGGEVGPMKGGAGSLALLYFGNSKTGPRLPDPQIALNAQSDVTEKLLQEAAANVLSG